MIRKYTAHFSWAISLLLGLVLTLLLQITSLQAASLNGREFLGPVRVEFGDRFQVAISNVWSTESSFVVVRIFNSDGALVHGFGVGKGTPIPQEIAPGATTIVEIVGGSDTPSTPEGEYTAIAELYGANGTNHAPLLSAQVVKSDGTTGIWGTGGVALNAIWGTGGVARSGIWGTGGVARTGIWGTGGVARQRVVGAFPLVKVGTAETYRLTAQNPYDDVIQIRMSALSDSGGVLAQSAQLTLMPGKTATLTVAEPGENVVGIIELVANGSGAGPLVTMQVLRPDGRAGIWGTGGVAYEAGGGN